MMRAGAGSLGGSVRAVVLAAVLFAVIATPVADAKPRLKPLGAGSVGVMSGGYVGLRSAPDKPFLLINEATGGVSSLALPPGCYGTYGLRFPLLLLDCSDGPRILNVDTGDVQSGPQPPFTSCEGGPLYYVDLGRYWIEGTCFGHNLVGVQFFLNWRTGEYRPGDVSEPFESSGPPFYDIDSPGLDASDGVRCPGLPGVFRSRTKWVVYRLKKSPKLRLRRCSGGRSIVLSNSSEATGVARKRAAAWVEGTKVGLYMTDSDRRYRWNAPPGHVEVALSSRYLYVQVSASDGYNSVYRAALPARAKLPQP